MEHEGGPVKILYLTYDGLTDPLGQSQILPYLCGLSELGYHFTVISFEKPARFEELRNEIELICNQYHIDWVPFIYHKFPPVFSTLLDLYRLKQQSFKLFRHNGYKIVHGRSYIPSLAGLWLKKKCGVKFLFDMRGFWADERVEGGIWSLKNPLYRVIYRYFKKKEIEMIREADRVITLTENAKKEILSWDFGPETYRLFHEKISVIPSCVDTEFFDPGKINHDHQPMLRNYLGIRENDFVLLYLGSLGTWYLLDEMLDFFQCLKDEIPGARFLILANDIDFAKKKLSNIFKPHAGKKVSESISEKYRELIIEGRKINPAFYFKGDDFILTQCPRVLTPLYISLASASIFFIKSSYSKKASSATKLGESLSMGIPVITNSGWGDNEQIIMNGMEYVIRSFTRENYLSIIKNLLSNNPVKNNFKNISVLKIGSLQSGIATYMKIYLTCI